VKNQGKNTGKLIADKGINGSETTEQYLQSNLRITRASEISIIRIKENLKAKIVEMENGGTIDEEMRAKLLECKLKYRFSISIS
jgi:hypothetical protein